jgi:hypothetical protein
MNSGDLSLFNVIVGVRGSGKTLLETYLQECALKRAAAIRLLRQIKHNPKYFPKRKTEVFSNYPLNYFLKPKPLEMEKLIVQAPEFANCEVFVDEIGGEADRQDWNNPKSKFLNFCIQVMRHRNITFTSTIQSFDWLNARMQWQTDVIVKCRDLAFTPWGRSCNLNQGEVISTVWIDKSGVLTGYSYDETHRVYSLKFFGKRVWGHYDTQHEVDIMGMNTKYEVEREVKRIGRDGLVINEQRIATDTALAQNIIHDTIDYFKHNQPGDRVSSAVFWEQCKERGMVPKDIDEKKWMAIRQEWGKYLKNGLHVITKSYSGRQMYDFGEADVT